VNPHHQIEVIDAHVPDRFVAHDARVVHHDVQSTQLRVRPLDSEVDLLLVSDVAEVRNRYTAAAFDDGDDLVGDLAATLTRKAGAQVVDDYRRAVLGEFERVSAADAVARPGHQGDLAVK
jgi:hypothetical protein